MNLLMATCITFIQTSGYPMCIKKEFVVALSYEDRAVNNKPVTVTTIYTVFGTKFFVNAPIQDVEQKLNEK